MSSELSRIRAARAMRIGLALACAAILCAALGACGSSAKTSAIAAASSKRSTTANGPHAVVTAQGSPHFAALRECLAKNGVKLPGGHGPGGVFLHRRYRGAPGSGPGGVSVQGGVPVPGGAPPAGRPPFMRIGGPERAKFQAALKKCGAPAGLGRFGARFGHARALLGSPAFKQALTKFAACMNRNGVKLPTPDTSGKGPVFDTKNVNTANAQFRSAQAKCRGLLAAAGLPGGPPAAAGAPGPGAGSPGPAGSPAGPESMPPGSAGAPPATGK